MDLNQPIYLSQKEADQFQRFGGNARLLSLSLQAMIEEDIKAELEDISRSQSSFISTDTLKQVVNSLDFLLEDDLQQASSGDHQSIGNIQDMSSSLVDHNSLVPPHPYQQQRVHHHQKQEVQFTNTQYPTQFTSGSYISQTSGTVMSLNGNGSIKQKLLLPATSTSFPAKKKPLMSHPAGYQGELSGFPKPAFSYTCLIGLALKNSQTGTMTVSEIYNFICDHFPYYTTAPSGWKNSVRHNLSLNNCFMKMERKLVAGNRHEKKGFLWAMNPLKISKVDEEVTKSLQRDPMGVRKGMLMPEVLEALERGEFVRDYSCSDDAFFSECSN